MTPHTRFRHPFLLLSFLIMLVGTGCESVPRPAKVLPPNEIRVGMTVEELDEKLGTPGEVEPATETNRMEETRYYTVEHPPVYRPITTGMQEIPYVDPITGIMRMIKEPITAKQRINREEKITIVIRHNQVIRVDRRTSENSSFSR